MAEGLDGKGTEACRHRRLGQKRRQNDGVERFVEALLLPFPSRGTGQHRSGRRGAGRLERAPQTAGSGFGGDAGGNGGSVPGCGSRHLGGVGGDTGPLPPGAGLFGPGGASGIGEAGRGHLRKGDRSGVGGFSASRRPPGADGWSL